MAYIIELVCLGEDFYSILDASAKKLNCVQKEFEFRSIPVEERNDGLKELPKKWDENEPPDYYSLDVWTFLRNHREKYRGHRQFLLAFVNTPLRSPRGRGLFGSHAAKEGLAAATIFECVHFVKEIKRFCCYYMTRYAMSFANHELTRHEEPDRADCYFHYKRNKREILLSLDSGNLCKICDDALNKKLSNSEAEALSKMRMVVSGDHPIALVMKGGGVKGLAFASALCEIEKYFYFNRHVGTSAGAITAVLLAAGYKPNELEQILRQKNFRDFLDPLRKIPRNLLQLALFSGNHFQEWMKTLLKAKFPDRHEVKMSDLGTALIYACADGEGVVDFDSQGKLAGKEAAFATRCSMSIPILFIPQEMDGKRMWDGGMRNNFPLREFLQDDPSKPFVALYLGNRDPWKKKWFFIEWYNILTEGDERKVAAKHADKVIVIDTRPVKTADFDMSDAEKEFLLKLGKAETLQFIAKQNFTDGPSISEVTAARDAANEAKKAALEARRKRKAVFWLKIIVGALLICLVVYAAIHFELGKK